MNTSGKYFSAVVLEICGLLDAPVGRWTIRGHAGNPKWILNVEQSALVRAQIFKRSPKAIDQIPRSKVTVISAQPLEASEGQSDSESAFNWLAEANLERQVSDAVAALGQLLEATALSYDEPQPQRIRRQDLLTAVLAVGTGTDAVTGSFQAKRTANTQQTSPQNSTRAVEGVAANERIAQYLAGRLTPLTSERLLARAVADLESGKVRDSAMQLRVASEMAISELEAWRTQPGMSMAIESVRNERQAVIDLAVSAASGGLSGPEIQTLRRVISQVKAALHARYNTK